MARWASETNEDNRAKHSAMMPPSGFENKAYPRLAASIAMIANIKKETVSTKSVI